MESKRIGKQLRKRLYKTLSKPSDEPCYGVFCQMCNDWIVTPKEHRELDSLMVGAAVYEHYEAFHTAEEIEKFVGGKV